MSPRKSNANLGSVLGYTFPRLHEGKDWYVDFHAIDPETGKLKRKKYYITRQKSKREMRSSAAALIEKLGIQLRQGWTPWEANKNIKGTKLFDEVLEKYLSSVEISSRRTTLENYSSRVNVLRDYIKGLVQPIKYAFQFDRVFVTDFLDWVVEKRGASTRTRNNYRAWCFVLAEFMIERQYITENPVTSIRKLREPKKVRQPLTAEMLRELWKHLRKEDPHFLLACLMEYYTFIRPNELRHIKVRDINVMQQTVFVPAEFSKNRMDGKVSLNEDIITLMVELGVLTAPADHYLFSLRQRPGAHLADPDMFNKRWQRVRKELKWPSEIKFYSLKDSGIRDLSNAAGVVTARDQARHQDISTTNKYLQGADLSAQEAAKHFRGALSDVKNPSTISAPCSERCGPVLTMSANGHFCPTGGCRNVKNTIQINLLSHAQSPMKSGIKLICRGVWAVYGVMQSTGIGRALHLLTASRLWAVAEHRV